jgi:arabinofuranosyltransferase
MTTAATTPGAAERRVPTRWLPWVGGAIALGYAFWLGLYYYDDAFISLRYADNLVAGNGLVFNRGEYVEGFTPLLWVLLLAAARGVGLPPLTTLSVLNAASAVLALALVARAGRFARGSDPASNRRPELFTDDVANTAALLFAASAPFLVLAQGGMDSMLGCALLTATVLVHPRSGDDEDFQRAVAQGLLATAAYLVRPELGVVAFVLGLDLLRRFAWRSALVYGATAGLSMLAHLLWRLAYYGEYLPNTALAKADAFGEHWPAGLLYVLAFAIWSAWPLCVLALFGLGRAVRSGRHALWLVPVAATTVAIGVGGDYMPGYRFLLPAVPCLALLAAGAVTRAGWICAIVLLLLQILHAANFSQEGSPFTTAAPWQVAALFGLPALALVTGAVVRIATGRAVALRVGIGAFAVLHGVLGTEIAPWLRPDQLTSFSVSVHVNAQLEKIRDTDTVGRAIGDWLKQQAAQREGETWIAVDAAGAVPYFSGLPTIDMLGLTDAHIARREIEKGGAFFPGHQKGDGRYVFERRPDYIVFGHGAGTVEPQFLSDRELLAIPEFSELYEQRTVRLPLRDRSFPFHFRQLREPTKRGRDG